MKNKFIACLLTISTCCFSSAYALQDLTGTYKCTGVDTKDGQFTAIDTMLLDKKNSTNKIAGYTMTVPKFQGGLSGFASFDGKNLAIYFHSLDNSTEDAKNNYGVMIAHVTKHGIKKAYYEPVYKGGSTGVVDCIKVSSKIDAPSVK